MSEYFEGSEISFLNDSIIELRMQSLPKKEMLENEALRSEAINYQDFS
ncbi:MAG: hypothetical protein AAFY45_22870 [Bacteroidota bacterium]